MAGSAGVKFWIGQCRGTETMYVGFLVRNEEVPTSLQGTVVPLEISGVCEDDRSNPQLRRRDLERLLTGGAQSYLAHRLGGLQGLEFGLQGSSG